MGVSHVNPGRDNAVVDGDGSQGRDVQESNRVYVSGIAAKSAGIDLVSVAMCEVGLAEHHVCGGVARECGIIFQDAVVFIVGDIQIPAAVQCQAPPDGISRRHPCSR